MQSIRQILTTMPRTVGHIGVAILKLASTRRPAAAGSAHRASLGPATVAAVSPAFANHPIRTVPRPPGHPAFADLQTQKIRKTKPITPAESTKHTRGIGFVRDRIASVLALPSSQPAREGPTPTPSPYPSIKIIYDNAILHFQNFACKLKFLAMPSSFTGRLAIVPVVIPVVSIIAVVVIVPV
jgi:hypothetical protein